MEKKAAEAAAKAAVCTREKKRRRGEGCVNRWGEERGRGTYHAFQLAREKRGAAQAAGGAVDQLIDSMRTGEAFNKREKGSAINSNAVLAAEAIEMFSKVNNRRKYASFSPSSVVPSFIFLISSASPPSRHPF